MNKSRTKPTRSLRIARNGRRQTNGVARNDNVFNQFANNLILTATILLLWCSVLTKCDTNLLNEIDNGSQVHTKTSFTELQGGRIISEKWLRHMESPYTLHTDLLIERTGRLYIEPGVRVHVAPMVGITVRGVLNALVSCYCTKYASLRRHHILSSISVSHRRLMIVPIRLDRSAEETDE